MYLPTATICTDLLTIHFSYLSKEVHVGRYGAHQAVGRPVVSQVVSFIDLAGHERYLRTTVYAS